MSLWDMNERKVLLQLVRDKPVLIWGMMLDFFEGELGELDFEDMVRENAGLPKRYDTEEE